MTNAVRTGITKDGVLVVTIDRAARRNALDLEAWQGLQDGLALSGRAEVGAVVLTGAGQIVEIQATGEKRGFSRAEFDRLFELASGGCETLFALQRQALENLAPR